MGQKSIFYDILERRNAFLGYKKKKVEKVEKLTFFQRFWFWFLSKNGHFSNFVFSGNIGQANIFHDILADMNAFLGYKNKKFKKSKN